MKPKIKSLKKLLIAGCFLLPNFLGFFIFTFLAVLASLTLSFTQWDLLTPPRWVGLSNFIQVLGFTKTDGVWHAHDPEFWRYLYNTLYLMGGIPIGMAGSLLLAIGLNQRFRGVVILRTIYFLPSVCVPVAIFLLWRWIYNPDYGMMNWLFSLFGIQPIPWLTSTTWSKPALILTGLWSGVGGFNMILFLAGLQNIPQHYYEAAVIDGANRWQQFLHITWPLLTPTTFFIFTISLIWGFQGGFEAAYMMTGGGPAGSTMTLMYYIYNNAFEWSKMGYAATIAWILFVFVFLVTLLNWRFGGRRVHY